MKWKKKKEADKEKAAIWNKSYNNEVGEYSTKMQLEEYKQNIVYFQKNKE